jgi:hypothetical protein
VKTRFLLSHGGDCRFLDLDNKVLVDQNNKRGHHPMPTKDDFTPDYHLPVFLFQHADEPEQPGIGIAWDSAVISSRILKTSILVVTAAAIAIVWMENPVGLFANVTASLVDISAFQLGTNQWTPTIQSTAGAEALSPTARDTPPVNSGANPESALPSDDKTAARDALTRDEIAAAFKPADQSQTEIRQPSAGALLKQFQAWAADEDVQALVVQPLQDAQEQVVQNAPAQVRPMQEHRHVRRVQNARAEMRPERHPRAKVRREQNARVQIRSAQDAPAQDQSVQNAQAPSFLQSLGLRD